MVEGMSPGEYKKPEWTHFSIEGDVDFAEDGGYLGGIIDLCKLNPQLIGLYVDDIETRIFEARDMVTRMGDPSNFQNARIFNLEKLERKLLDLISSD